MTCNANGLHRLNGCGQRFPWLRSDIRSAVEIPSDSPSA